ncbi:MAG: TatD family hydrolase [Chthoniobacterales bacterium]|nr:TatD family hydrolase [Chthoniobacterales bacterium]
MKLVETHAHLDHPKFADDLPALIQRAHDAGVTRIISIGTGLESSRSVLALAERFPSVFVAIGIHPTEIDDEKGDFISALRELARHPKVVAIGEIGIDYFHQPSNSTETANSCVAPVLGSSSTSCKLRACAPSAPYSSSVSANLKAGEAIGTKSLWKKNQASAFQQQLDLAVELGLNVIIHQRDVAGSNAAWEETLRILKPYTGKLRAVFHCFGGTPEQAAKVIALGHLVSFTGIVTFKNAPLVRATVAAIPADAYMVETDCPYLAPDPYRGQRAEPWHTRLVAEKIAQIRGLTLEEVAMSTTKTAEEFFAFSLK